MGLSKIISGAVNGIDAFGVEIEVNLTYGEISFHQFNNGPLFGEDTREILDEIFGK